jgi:signal transduction histidine kinase
MNRDSLRALKFPSGVFSAPAFRMAGIAAGVFVLGMLLLFAFIYWQTSISETRQIDRFIERQLGAMMEGGPDQLIGRLAASPDQGMAYAGLFDAARRRVAGNLSVYPEGLPADGHAHALLIGGVDAVRAAAAPLSGGQVIVIAREVTELRQLQRIVLRALTLGVIPAILLALLAGATLSWRASRRVRTVHVAAEHILRGDLGERLPYGGTADEFDRLAGAVNRMLDEIARLLDQVKGVGDDIAHDLRTPLTRVRARLERGLETARTRTELDDIVNSAIAGLDQTLTIVTALLRITELEDARRRAAFRDVELSRLLRDVAELYEPIAEAASVKLTVDANARAVVRGDRDLLIEAIANIVDNAIKFSPVGGTVSLALVAGETYAVVRVSDQGPGIPPDERQAVLRRFYRSDKSRHRPGSGLGLGLVDAIVRLHGFRIEIADAAPGCIFDLVCEVHSNETEMAESCRL